MTGDDRGVGEGGDEDRAAFALKGFHLLEGVADRRAEHHLSAVVADRFDLGLNRVLGHEDGAFDAGLSGRPGETLTVIAGGKGDDAVRLFARARAGGPR